MAVADRSEHADVHVLLVEIKHPLPIEERVLVLFEVVMQVSQPDEGVGLFSSISNTRR
jgi:hypothetical protein